MTTRRMTRTMICCHWFGATRHSVIHTHKKAIVKTTAVEINDSSKLFQ